MQPERAHLLEWLHKVQLLYHEVTRPERRHLPEWCTQMQLLYLGVAQSGPSWTIVGSNLLEPELEYKDLDPLPDARDNSRMLGIQDRLEINSRLPLCRHRQACGSHVIKIELLKSSNFSPFR